MGKALTCVMQPLPADETGFVVAHDATIADLLARDDAEACLTHGVRVARDGQPIGWVPPHSLAHLAAEQFQALRAERDAARRELEEVRGSRNALVGNLGHELRTPINAIVGYAELIRGGLPMTADPRTQAAYVDIIWEAAHHLLGTIDSILDLTRIQANEVELRESEVGIGALVDSVRRLLASTAGVRSIDINLAIDPDLPPLWADARMLRQILINLIGNAIKYTYAGSMVTVGARLDRRGRMVIEVSDRGPGIPEEAIEFVMQPFKQLGRRSEEGMMTGTGLGLPLVKALVELHDGSFRLLSTPGRGTRALVILPAGRVRGEQLRPQAEFAFQRAASSVYG